MIREKYLGSRFPDVECFLVLMTTWWLARPDPRWAPWRRAGSVLLPGARGHGIGRGVVAPL